MLGYGPDLLTKQQRLQRLLSRAKFRQPELVRREYDTGHDASGVPWRARQVVVAA